MINIENEEQLNRSISIENSELCIPNEEILLREKLSKETKRFLKENDFRTRLINEYTLDEEIETIFQEILELKKEYRNYSKDEDEKIVINEEIAIKRKLLRDNINKYLYDEVPVDELYINYENKLKELNKLEYKFDKCDFIDELRLIDYNPKLIFDEDNYPLIILVQCID